MTDGCSHFVKETHTARQWHNTHIIVGAGYRAGKAAGSRMEVIDSSLPGVLIVVPKRLGDPRGFFVETFQVERYAAVGITRPFVQDNLSRSARGVLRGLHLQNPNPQSKLVTVTAGRVLDVAVDVRRGSPNFGQSVAVELSKEERSPALRAQGIRAWLRGALRGRRLLLQMR